MTKRKWLVFVLLIVISALIIPYKITAKDTYLPCPEKQSSEVSMKALAYRSGFYIDCSVLVHYGFVFPSARPKHFQVVFMWTANTDSGQYEFWVADHRIPNDIKYVIYCNIECIYISIFGWEWHRWKS